MFVAERELYFDPEFRLLSRMTHDTFQNVINTCRMEAGAWGKTGKLLGHTAAQLCSQLGEGYHERASLAVRLHEGGYVAVYAAMLGNNNKTRLRHTNLSEIMENFGFVRTLIPEEISKVDYFDYVDMRVQETLADIPELVPTYEIITDKIAEGRPPHDLHENFFAYGLCLTASRLVEIENMLTTPQVSDVDTEAFAWWEIYRQSQGNTGAETGE